GRQGPGIGQRRGRKGRQPRADDGSEGEGRGHLNAAEEVPMPAVKCSVNGCNAVLQPLLKPDARDKTTWIYPECDLCSRPVCEEHASEVEGQVVCGRCLE